MAPGIFYQHLGEHICGDFIPFYDRKSGRYHLFYIQWNAWHHISTADFVDIAYHGIALDGEGEQAQDQCIYTGCVMEKDGLYYIYFTGHNDFPEKNGLRYKEVIYRATSPDLMTWTKDRQFVLPPDETRFSTNSWRDPHIMRMEDGRYIMTLTAEEKDKPSHRKGCTPTYVSDDMLNWEYAGVLYSPTVYDTQECTDLFKWGDWYYLFFSTANNAWETHYRMARSLDGPWLRAPEDTIDAQAFYAAKTVTDGQNRYLVGWASNKDNKTDGGWYSWGGRLVVHQLVQAADGTLGAKAPDAVCGAFTQPQALPDTTFRSTREDAFTYVPLGEAAEGEELLFTGKLRTVNDARPARAGLILRAQNGSLDEYYRLCIEMPRNRVFLSYPGQFFTPYREQKHLPHPAKDVTFTVIVSEDLIVAYVGGAAFTARIYDYKAGQFGLFFEECDAEIADLRIWKR